MVIRSNLGLTLCLVPMFTGFGVSCVIGPPVAALLVDYTHSYKYPVFVAFAAAGLALLLVLPLRARATQTAKRAAAGVE